MIQKDKYTFVVDGEAFTSTRIIADELLGSKDTMRDIHRTLERTMDLDEIVRSTLDPSDIKKENRSGDHPTVTIARNLGLEKDFKLSAFQKKGFRWELGKIYGTIRDGNRTYKLSTYQTKSKNIYPLWYLNEYATPYFIMQLGKYKNARLVQRHIADSFVVMRDFINEMASPERHSARKDGKVVRRFATDALKSLLSTIKRIEPNSSLANPKNKAMIYITYSNMANNAIIGMTSKKYKELNGLGKKDAIRDTFDRYQLAHYQKIEMMVEATIIKCLVDLKYQDKPNFHKAIFQECKEKTNRYMDLMREFF